MRIILRSALFFIFQNSIAWPLWWLLLSQNQFCYNYFYKLFNKSTFSPEILNNFLLLQVLQNSKLDWLENSDCHSIFLSTNSKRREFCCWYWTQIVLNKIFKYSTYRYIGIKFCFGMKLWTRSRTTTKLGKYLWSKVHFSNFITKTALKLSCQFQKKW